MANNAVMVGVTGIVVSGVVGPTVAAWFARRSRSREFHREQVAARRNELRKLLDEAASLLASGPMNLRILHEQQAGTEVEDARIWLSQVFPIGQRLQLWLPANHPVITSYECVREHLVEAARVGAAPGVVCHGKTTAGVATFFLGTFLGCRLKDSPEKSTLEFVQAADGFINGAVQSPERRGRYQVALLASMQDQTAEIRPRSFAQAHLEAADRPAFLDRVREAGLDPDKPFPKDTSLVRVSGFKMTFESGMVLVGSQDDLRERVDIRLDGAEAPGVDINDAIKKLRGR